MVLTGHLALTSCGKAISDPPLACKVARLGTNSFDIQMIKHYLIVKLVDLLSHTPLLKHKPFLIMYMHEALEYNMHCF